MLVKGGPAIVLPTILKPLLVFNVASVMAFCQPDPSHHLTQFWHNNQCGILAWPSLLLLYFPCPISTIETALLWWMRQISLPLAGSETKRRVFAHLVLIFPSDIDGQSSDLASMVLAIISKVVVHDEACTVSETVEGIVLSFMFISFRRTANMSWRTCVFVKKCNPPNHFISVMTTSFSPFAEQISSTQQGFILCQNLCNPALKRTTNKLTI